jgi:hypothetical protein
MGPERVAHADGTVAVNMDPLSLLCLLATSAPLAIQRARAFEGGVPGVPPDEASLSRGAWVETRSGRQAPSRPRPLVRAHAALAVEVLQGQKSDG